MSRTRSSSDDALLAAALDYHRRGWGVIPLYSICDGKCTCAEESCTHPGKHPLASWKQYQSRRPSKAEIRAWWAQYPDANVGIITGSATGLVVLDVDPRNGGQTTLDSLLARYGPLPKTFESCTGGGGRHIFFAYARDNAQIASKANALGLGLDVKAD